ncbi:MAG: hypothetical protein K0S45_3300 [Nitrospira sp.]|jgi:hypothetical protein|nr:hypothetical protein [Nitrospira sp.]
MDGCSVSKVFSIGPFSTFSDHHKLELPTFQEYVPGQRHVQGIIVRRDNPAEELELWPLARDKSSIVIYQSNVPDVWECERPFSREGSGLLTAFIRSLLMSVEAILAEASLARCCHCWTSLPACCSLRRNIGARIENYDGTTASMASPIMLSSKERKPATLKRIGLSSRLGKVKDLQHADQSTRSMIEYHVRSVS